MQLGLSTAAFYGRYETEDAAARVAQLPLDCAEVFLQSESENTVEFAQLVKRNLAGTPCTSMHPLGGHENYMAGRPARQVRDAFDQFRRLLDAGQALGAEIYVYHGRNTPLLKPVPWNLQWNVEAIAPMCEEVEKRGMVIAWENVCWCQLTEPVRVLEAKDALPQVQRISPVICVSFPLSVRCMKKGRKWFGTANSVQEASMGCCTFFLPKGQNLIGITSYSLSAKDVAPNRSGSPNHSAQVAATSA